MSRSRSKNKSRVFLPLCLALALCLSAAGQSRNSPSPVLLPQVKVEKQGKPPIGTGSDAKVFTPGTRIELRVENVASSLLKGEGANAFRLYAADKTGRIFRFGGLSLTRVPALRDGISLTLDLVEETGNWSPPQFYDGMPIWLTWRGMASNVTRFDINAQNVAAKSAPKPTTANGGPEPEGGLISYDRARFIQQATFGFSTYLENHVRIKGLNGYLNEQFGMTVPGYAYPNAPGPYKMRPPSPPNFCNGTADANSQPVDPVDDPIKCHRNTYTMYPMQKWFFQEALGSTNQLRHRVAWALSQIWVTSSLEIQQSRHMAEYYKVLYDHAFGNYRDLMQAMTLNPAMGEYLDMSVSTAASPNENYPRELMQLFTLGVHKLEMDGTIDCDGAHIPCLPTDAIPTYTQANISNFARVFTGWSFCPGEGCPSAQLGSINFTDPMTLRPENHDIGAKTLLQYPGSVDVPGCIQAIDPDPCVEPGYGTQGLNLALNNIYGHQNVAPFVSKLLIQNLVRSDPTPAYVGRVAAVFEANRTSSTQLQEVIRTILLDPEARGDEKTDPTYGKMREPIQLATHMLKALNVKGHDTNASTDGVITSNDKFRKMSQLPFTAPSVFSYYSPKNVIVVAGSDPENPDELLAPEFMLMTPITSVARPNFANLIIFTPGIVPTTGTDPDIPTGTSVDLAGFAAIAQQDPKLEELMFVLNYRLLSGSMSQDMKQTIIDHVLDPKRSTDPLDQAKEAIYLIVTSSQFQIQR